MDVLANWETMRMNDPAYIQNQIDNNQELRVFLPLRQTLLPENQFLERSAIVMTGPNHNDHQLINRLKRKLGYHFGHHPRQFEIRKIPASMGDLIAIFPNEDMMKETVQICVFDLGSGVQVQLKAWNLSSQMETIKSSGC